MTSLQNAAHTHTKKKKTENPEQLTLVLRPKEKTTSATVQLVKANHLNFFVSKGAQKKRDRWGLKVRVHTPDADPTSIVWNGL
jgi:hypothetical protein